MGDVIPFPTPVKRLHKRFSRGLGVFINPPGCSTSAFILGGSVAGFIDRWTAFHKDFEPNLFGEQERQERGIQLNTEPVKPEPDGAA